MVYNPGRTAGTDLKDVRVEACGVFECGLRMPTPSLSQPPVAPMLERRWRVDARGGQVNYEDDERIMRMNIMTRIVVMVLVEMTIWWKRLRAGAHLVRMPMEPIRKMDFMMTGGG